MNIIGYFRGIDPAACLISDGQIVAFVEEERLIRFKHAAEMFPIRSVDFCLDSAGLSLKDIDFFAFGWDSPRYTNGQIKAFFEQVNRSHPPDPGTLSWQKGVVAWFNEGSLKKQLQQEIVRYFGRVEAPQLRFFPHHKSHAATAFYCSPFDEALVFTIDGSGDHQCATLWHGKGTGLRFLDEITIPHSLGWFYAAMTEYLGFDAYDGEYKVMGLAAYGRENPQFRHALQKVIRPGPRGFDYVVNPRYIHHGPHTYSSRFTDHMVELLGLPPRQGKHALEEIHEDLAFETQHALESHVLRLLEHFRQTTGLENLCIGGGVALNVKLNSKIHQSGLFEDLFIFPIPSDSGTGIGAGIGIYNELTGKRPAPLKHVYLGPSFTDVQIEAQLKSCGLAYRRPENLEEETADLLASGKVLGWFQAALEGGPRALGARSILADPRNVTARDRVNSAIKFREYWRPFCPSLTVESAGRFMKRAAAAPVMIRAFEATEEASRSVPGVVHIDNTMRVQTVDSESNPRYYRLLKAFERKAGVPVLLNTSFNIKGEPIVCSPRDALRTFWSTGIDCLVIGSFIVEKPESPARLKPEDVIR
jgi:carbamoyltransferase